MFKEILQSIEGLEIFTLIGMILFFTIFLMLVFRTVKMNKQEIRHLENLPLEKDN